MQTRYIKLTIKVFSRVRQLGGSVYVQYRNKDTPSALKVAFINYSVDLPVIVD